MVHSRTDAKPAAASLCPVCRSTVVETVVRRIELSADQPSTLEQVRRDCTVCPWVDVVERQTPRGRS
jgi:hypothetical protein